MGGTRSNLSDSAYRLVESLANHQFRRERILACARVVLALGFLLLGSFDAPGLLHSHVVVLLLTASYLALALSALVLACVFTTPPRALQVCAHAIDLAYAPLIYTFLGHAQTPMMLILLFAILTAAYRWGIALAFATAVASVLLMWLAKPDGVWLASGSTLSFSALYGAFDTVIGGAACLLFWAILLGYLADREKSLNFQAFALGRSLAQAPAELSLRSTFEELLSAVRKVMNAREIVVVVQDQRSRKDFAWSLVEAPASQSGCLRLRQLGPTERQQYFFNSPRGSWQTSFGAPRDPGEMLRCLIVNSEGQRLPDQYFSFADAFFLSTACSTVLAVELAASDELSGRLFLLDCESGMSPAADLAFVQSLAWEATPSLYSIHLLGRLRSRARADERGRIAHEIHDGLLQSLISVEMQMGVLHRRAALSSPGLATELASLHEILQREVLETRAIMENLKLKEMSPREMLDVASEMVATFQRETGIAATFECHAEDVNFPPYVCRQLASILHEALTNVRKHSKARNVRVNFALDGAWWKLVVTDDGEGFKFSDRHTEAEPTEKVPTVLRERARSIGAELDLASSPGQGSCVEIRLRRQESFR